jgi:hypothetical protein
MSEITNKTKYHVPVIDFPFVAVCASVHHMNKLKCKNPYNS